MQLQLARLDEPARPGVAFSLVRKLLAFRVGDRPGVEVVILSRNDPVSGMRVFRSARHYGLPIERGVFSRGESPWRYLRPLRAHLFLSMHESDVRAALAAGVPAARVYPQSAPASDAHADELRIAFDGDAVLFSDEAERVYQRDGLGAFQRHEQTKAGTPLPPGPFKPLLEALHRLRAEASGAMRIRTALVTARSAPAHERAIRTLMDWQVEVDEAMFLGRPAQGRVPARVRTRLLLRRPDRPRRRCGPPRALGPCGCRRVQSRCGRMTATPTVAPSTAAPTRHPAGLRVIFFTEMWERFSYYGMRSLLVLYLVNALHLPRTEALALYGVYTGLVYVTPLIGGHLADRWLGARQAAVAGAAIMMLGHFAMAFDGLLHLALGLLIIGNGFFKANTSSMVGMLYGPDDPRRAGGYTLFYMGVNLGAFLAPLVAGTLGQQVGWHWGFASAGVGMAIGLVVLLRGQRLLDGAGLRPGQGPVGRADAPRILGLCAASVAGVAALLALWRWAGPWWAGQAGPLRWGLVAAVAALLLWRPARQQAPGPALSPAEKRHVLALFIVAFFVIFFWMGFEQAGGSMALFADEQTDRRLLGFEFPSSWFQAVAPLAIVLLAPLFSTLWIRLDQSRFALPDPAKQGLGMVVLGLGFVVLAMAQARADASGPVGPQWLTLVYLLHTVGELMLSPVGLSMVSRMAPQRLAGLLMGVWLLAIGIANTLAGLLEGLLAGSGVPLFVFLISSSFGAGVLILLATPWLQRLMRPAD